MAEEKLLLWQYYWLSSDWKWPCSMCLSINLQWLTQKVTRQSHQWQFLRSWRILVVMARRSGWLCGWRDTMWHSSAQWLKAVISAQSLVKRQWPVFLHLSAMTVTDGWWLWSDISNCIDTSDVAVEINDVVFSHANYYSFMICGGYEEAAEK